MKTYAHWYCFCNMEIQYQKVIFNKKYNVTDQSKTQLSQLLLRPPRAKDICCSIYKTYITQWKAFSKKQTLDLQSTSIAKET